MFYKRFSRELFVSLFAAGVMMASDSMDAGDINLGTSFTYQGYLYEAGEEASGDYDFNFTLWDDGLAGAQVGGPLSPSNVTVVDGRFTVELDFGFGVFNGSQRWLEIEVRPAGGGSFTLLDPRQLLTATPYAQALRLPYYATQLQNGASFAITNPHASGTAAIFQVTNAGNSYEGVLGLNAGSGAGVRGQSDGFGPGVAGMGFYGLRGETPTSSGFAVYGLNANGNYGYIGDDQYALFAHHDLSGNTVYAGHEDFGLVATTTTLTYFQDSGLIGRSATNFGVVGLSDATSGVIGQSSSGALWHFPNSGTSGYSPDGYGIGAVSTSGTAVYAHNRDINTYGRLATPNYGVYGRSPVSDGVYGQTNSTSANVSGVYGLVNSSSPGSYSTGVFGQNNGTGGLGIGVRGRHNGSGWGVLGESPDGVGVYGSSAGGLAGYFAGDVIVTGTLSGTVSVSKIDHPLDPENMYLHHSGVASSEMLNLYNGNVVTDINGQAWVELPLWFEELNRDFRYQLTVIGQFAQAIVAEKVSGGRFLIETDRPDVEVSWQISGIRNDAWANANRPAVEVAKAADERGKYLHPVVFGESPTQGVDYHEVPADKVQADQLEPDAQPLQAVPQMVAQGDTP